MKLPIYVTGNANKAKLFNEMVGIALPHQNLDIEEIQSLDLEEIVKEKAISAFQKCGEPVVVEDTSLSFSAMGRLPGPLIKWFLEELTTDEICKLLDSYLDRSAVASCAIAYYDGQDLQVFKKTQKGEISRVPGKRISGFGWDEIFIPDGESVTRSEMDEKTYKKYYAMTKPFDELKVFLQNR